MAAYRFKTVTLKCTKCWDGIGNDRGEACLMHVPVVLGVKGIASAKRCPFDEGADWVVTDEDGVPVERSEEVVAPNPKCWWEGDTDA